MKVLVTVDFSLPTSRRYSPTFFKFFLAALKQSGVFSSVDTLSDELMQEMVADDALLGGALTPLSREAHSARYNKFEKLLASYDFVLMFEPRKITRRWFNESKINVLYFFFHPAHFAGDLLFSVNTNHSGLKEKLAKHGIPESELIALANYWKALIAENDPLKNKKVVPGAGLVIGQWPGDLSLWDEARQEEMRLSDFQSTLQAAAQTHSQLYFKHHPLAPHLSKKEWNVLGLTCINHNVYQLLASGRIKTVYAISSSVVKEAEYFGLAAQYLAAPYFNEDESDITIDKRWFMPDFWQSLFTEMPTARIEASLMYSQPCFNIAHIGRSYWSYPYLEKIATIPARCTRAVSPPSGRIGQMLQVLYIQQKRIVNTLIKCFFFKREKKK
jgi:hypothetical protein